jgi:hypothetical protein
MYFGSPAMIESGSTKGLDNNGSLDPHNTLTSGTEKRAAQPHKGSGVSYAHPCHVLRCIFKEDGFRRSIESTRTGPRYDIDHSFANKKGISPIFDPIITGKTGSNRAG